MKTILTLLLLIPSLGWGLTFKDGKKVEDNKSSDNFEKVYAEVLLPDDVDWLEWIDLEILEFCKSSENVLIAYKAKVDGVWETYTFPIKKDENITLHQEIDGDNKWFINEKFEMFPMKNTDMDIVEIRDNTEGYTLDDIIINCRENKTIIENVEYETYDVFLQDDLFNGLSDNQKIKAKGTLEIPTQDECKKIEKYPLMFLIHHSGGYIMKDYKYILHEMCVATFEPFIFKARGFYEAEYNTDDDVKWTTETAGVIDSYLTLDILAEDGRIDSSKIGIIGWSWGGIVAIETQHIFNIDLLKPKNNFMLHFAVYPFCNHYEGKSMNTTDAPLFIFSGELDTITPFNQCEEYIEISKELGKKQKNIITYPNTTHSWDELETIVQEYTMIDPECRVTVKEDGDLIIKPNDPNKWFNVTQNGGWFGDKGNKEIYSFIMEKCWGWGRVFSERNYFAYQNTLKVFRENIKRYLIN